MLNIDTYTKLPVYNMKLALRNFNAQVSKENIYMGTIRKYSLHDELHRNIWLSGAPIFGTTEFIFKHKITKWNLQKPDTPCHMRHTSCFKYPGHKGQLNGKT